MHVLVLGGYGLIGLEVTRRLVREHRVSALGRDTALGARLAPDVRWIKADIATLSTPALWSPLLEGVDAIVNASGALQDSARDNLAAVQDVAIRALIAACEAKNVRCFVQISAGGATERASSPFLRTKAAADAALKQSKLHWVIVRPGLVWAPTATGGTALVRMLSAFPAIQPIVLADARVQMADIDDVTGAAAAAIHGAISAGADIDIVEAQPRTLREIVAMVRAWHGFGRARVELHLPQALGAFIARLADMAGWLGWRSPLRTTSLRSLRDGVVGDPAPWRDHMHSPPTSFETSLQRRPATRQDRLFARAQLALPLIILALSAFWIASGVIGAVRLDAAAGVLPGAVRDAERLVIAGALADIALGLAVLWRPWARAACFGMIALTAAYLVAGSLLTPQLWLDPLGPFVKTLPAALLALVCAALLDER